MHSRFQIWTIRLLPFLCIPLMGGDCDDGDSEGGVIGLIVAIFQLVISIIEIAD